MQYRWHSERPRALILRRFSNLCLYSTGVLCHPMRSKHTHAIARALSAVKETKKASSHHMLALTILAVLDVLGIPDQDPLQQDVVSWPERDPQEVFLPHFRRP